jgi:hypothetical protein
VGQGDGVSNKIHIFASRFKISAMRRSEIITIINADYLAVSNNLLLTHSLTHSSSLTDQKDGAAARKGGAIWRDMAFPACGAGEA